MDVQQALLDRIRLGDRAGANRLLENWALEHGYERLVAEVLDPALLRIGEEWRLSDQVTLAQAYVAAKVTEDTLTRLANQRGAAATGRAPKGTVVLGNAEEDFLGLGRRMVGTFLQAEGWTVHDLGNDVPASTFVDKALEVGAQVIGVSAGMMTTARNIRRIREEIDHRGLNGRLLLAVGGSVFRLYPELPEEIGADGSAPNALAAVALVERLQQRAQAQASAAAPAQGAGS